jgi:branched-subunit amino acid transport protein
MTLIYVMLSVAVGTYALRVAGPVLSYWVDLPDATKLLFTHAAIVLLFALVVTSTFIQGANFAGWSRLIGVGVGAFLIVVRAPLALALGAGIATTAGLRWLGIA